MIETYPETRREAVSEELHGTAIADPYRWLEDAQAGETAAWTTQQDQHARAMLGARPGRDAIRRRLTQLLALDTAQVPLARGGRYFFIGRNVGDPHYSIRLRRELNGPDEVILDPASVAVGPGRSTQFVNVSESGKLVVYAIRRGGEDEVELGIYDVDRGVPLPGVLPRGRYVDFAPIMLDDSGLFYSRAEPDGCHVYRHTFDGQPDRQIFSTSSRDRLVSCTLSEDGQFLLLQVQQGAGRHQVIELYLQDLAHDAEPRRLSHDATAMGVAKLGENELFVMTSSNAPNRRIVALDLTDGGRSGRWREVIPEGPAVIEKFTPAAGRVFVQYVENAASRLHVFKRDGTFEREVTFGSIGQVSKVLGQWSSPEVFISFGTFHVPLTIYRYDAEAGTLAVWFRENAPVDFDAFEAHQLWYQGKDGTRIPMFVVHKRGLARDVHHPTILTGYGGFGRSEKPWFRQEAVLWVEQGGVYAVANVRGGGEFGEPWHDGGKLANKQVSFDDFIAAAEHLIESGYTTPDRLAIVGDSNGALMVAAALTQRPSLFRAAVCRHPIADMIRYHRFSAGRFWIPEYGCADDPAQCAYLLEYSPYHQAKSGVAYPAILLRTGGMDTRVDPSHARKLTAMLQSATTSSRPVLLRCDAAAGHTRTTSPRMYIDELTDDFSFLCWQLDVPVA
jgi:prolyl oligopeptidase